MRKLIAYLATSTDGFIAREDGDVAWLDRPRPKGSYGMAAFYASVDAVVMGRATFDFARRFGEGGSPGKTTYVFSRTLDPGAVPQVTVVRESPAEFAQRLRASPGKNVWLMGGAQLFGAFLDAGELDELIVHVVPVLIGQGIPLLSPRRREQELALQSSRRFADGVVRLHYAVPSARRPRSAEGGESSVPA
jgi:dihydrofolate reductase